MNDDEWWSSGTHMHDWLEIERFRERKHEEQRMPLADNPSATPRETQHYEFVFPPVDADGVRLTYDGPRLTGESATLRKAQDIANRRGVRISVDLVTARGDVEVRRHREWFNITPTQASLPRADENGRYRLGFGDAVIDVGPRRDERDTFGVVVTWEDAVIGACAHRNELTQLGGALIAIAKESR